MATQVIQETQETQGIRGNTGDTGDTGDTGNTGSDRDFLVKSIGTNGGEGNTCVLLENGKVYCWGFTSFIPIEVDTTEIGEIESIAVGSWDACLLNNKNEIYCWGYPDHGFHITPEKVNTDILSNKKIVSMAAGSGHTCIVNEDGEAYCWGQNYDCQLGNAETADDYDDFSEIVAVDTNGVLNGKKLNTIGVFCPFPEKCRFSSATLI